MYKIGDKVNYIGDIYDANRLNPCTIEDIICPTVLLVSDKNLHLWELYDNEIELIENCKGNCIGCKCKEDIETNSNGGKGAYTGTRMDLIPAKALIEIGKVMYEGALKYDENNWRKVEIKSHINHAIKHVYEYLDKNTFEDITHAATRLLMAIELLRIEI